MLWAYFDESGKWSDSDFVCMAGYVLDTDHADSFVGQWKKLLHDHGISGIHMRQLIALQGQYKELGWDRAKANQVIGEAIKIINGTLTVGLAVAVDTKYFRSMSEEKRGKFGGDPHFFCFSRIMRMVVDILQHVRLASALIFDDSEQYSVKCYHLYGRLRKERPEIKTWISNICFADDERILPLQAADILAYLTADNLKQEMLGHKSRPDYIGLVTPDPQWPIVYNSELWDGEELEKIAAHR